MKLSSLFLFLLNDKIRNFLDQYSASSLIIIIREFNFVKIRDQVGETRFRNHRINNKNISYRYTLCTCNVRRTLGDFYNEYPMNFNNVH